MIEDTIPILQIDDLLVVSVQIELNDSQAMKLQQSLAARLSQTNAAGVVIDLTPVKMVDSFIARVIGETAEIAKLMGADLVVTGIQPAVAVTLVELGVGLSGVVTALNLQRGVDLLRKRRPK